MVTTRHNQVDAKAFSLFGCSVCLCAFVFSILYCCFDICCISLWSQSHIVSCTCIGSLFWKPIYPTRWVFAHTILHSHIFSVDVRMQDNTIPHWHDVNMMDCVVWRAHQVCTRCLICTILCTSCTPVLKPVISGIVWGTWAHCEVSLLERLMTCWTLQLSKELITSYRGDNWGQTFLRTRDQHVVRKHSAGVLYCWLFTCFSMTEKFRQFGVGVVSGASYHVLGFSRVLCCTCTM